MVVGVTDGLARPLDRPAGTHRTGGGSVVDGFLTGPGTGRGRDRDWIQTDGAGDVTSTTATNFGRTTTTSRRTPSPKHNGSGRTSSGRSIPDGPSLYPNSCRTWVLTIPWIPHDLSTVPRSLLFPPYIVSPLVTTPKRRGRHFTPIVIKDGRSQQNS